MQSKMLNSVLRAAGFAGFLLAAGVSSAATHVYLQAQSFAKDVGDGVMVDMWGFASCNDNFSVCSAPDAPGMPIEIDASLDSGLIIHLTNTLPTPVSIVIPGQVGGGNPEIVGGRVRSFTAETAAGSVTTPSAETTYMWSSLRPGTYLYQSGTHPSLQVPMGLYGALVVVDGDYPGFTYDNDAVLLFSEIDPVQNGRVAAAAEGAGTPTQACVTLAELAGTGTDGYPCTIDYNPMYFLVNGAAAPNLAGFVAGNDVLLRLLNAGLRTHTPALVGVEMTLLAEDGNLYPGLPLRQSEALLPAGKTLDALVTLPATADLTLPLLDRSPSFSDGNQPTGGALVTVQVGNGSTVIPAPTAIELVYDVVEDTPLTFNPPGGNALQLVTKTQNGTIEQIGPTGPNTLEYRYTPNPEFSGTDAFTYYRPGNDTTYHVTLNVSFLNDAPVAANDAYTNNLGSVITVAAPGVLGNDMDADGDPLYAVLDTGSVTLNDDGSFTTATGGSFTYFACDLPLEGGACPAGSASAAATVSLTVNAASGIVLNVQEPGGAAVSDYRWTVEEDQTYHPDPGDPTAPSLATDFHRSYMPVVAQGCSTATACSTGEEPTPFTEVALDPTKHYYVSVLPADAVSEDDTGYRLGHTVGGAEIPPGAASVTVNVNKEPLPYAQISIFVFDDSGRTNGAVDPGETGLGGFQVTLEDAGGRYGISAGTMSQDADGNPLTNALDCFNGAPQLPGVILSCPDTQANRDAGLVGQVLIQNLFPAKYGIITTPPEGAPTAWVQTSTIEGTKVIDAWVKAGEPPFFTEFGPVGVHAFVGFVSPELTNARRGTGPNTVTGAVTNNHMSRPPNQTLWDSETYDAFAHTRPWVGLNSNGGLGPNIAAVQATLNDDGTATFEIPNVPDGDYQLVVWDSYLDQVIAYRNLSFPDPLNTAFTGDVGNVPVFNWFARMENHVYLDLDGDGIRGENEEPLSEQAVNLRWRDGSVYQSFPTDLEGFVPFDQVFPFFNWLVAEVDYTRFEATGLTVTVDHGGDVSGTGNVLNPQQQADSTFKRTETGQVLTQGFQGFLGQTSVFEWGKRPYQPGVNGGISGIVYYGVTRAESDPRLAAAEPWEPGIPRVPVRLYRVVNREDSTTGLALVQETLTDSWDDSLPTDCPGADPNDHLIVGGPAGSIGKCYDGLRNFNQARPAVFDGGYAFNDIPAGEYVVEVVPPPGYELMKEEDVNVSFGDGYASVFIMMPGGAIINDVPGPAEIAALAAEPGLAQPPCVGELREVPLTMSLFPAANAEAPFGGAIRPLCDRKKVILSDQGQAAADFTLHTNAPIAAHFTGMILDDVAQEFNPLSPQFGEKWAPPFVPVSIRDYKGEEISRVYSDQWGRINGLMPSTFTANMPSPSGFSPAMHMTCMNDPGPIPGPDGPMVDPQYNSAYSNFCYTFQYMPGTTTYLDTPVLPVSAFASGYNPPDCSLDDATPMISRVRWNNNFDGPWFRTRTANQIANGQTRRQVVIRSMGRNVQVPNPAYEGPLGTEPKTITRDFDFGPSSMPGTVTVGGVELEIRDWNRNRIRAWIDATEDSSGQLVVTRGDNGNSTTNAVTVTVSGVNPIRVPQDHTTIQAAIDAADPGDLILVAPGVYNESIIMWKPVRLQGAGAGATLINAVKRPTESLLDWRAKMDSLFGINGGTKVVDSLPNQQDGAAGYNVSEGAAITVVGVFDPGQGQPPANSFLRGNGAARIDGFSITGADVGGGILVNSNAHNLEIANNSVYGNNGSYHGGVRIGVPFLELAETGPYEFNTSVNIHNNAVTNNGGLGGAGGGLSISAGSDDYTVSDNFVCGNFTTGDGGGIGHIGFSDNGQILRNRIEFNQTFNQALTVSGGGLFIGGEPVIAEFLELDNPNALGNGSGSVDVEFNLIRGNHAGAGHGGGIRTQFVNGQDIVDNNGVGQWHQIRIRNNVIVNNVTGWSGGGISLQDTVRSVIRNNTIAHNDSTATVGGLIDNNLSANQPAGVSTALHSSALAAAIPVRNNTADIRVFSNPDVGGGNSNTNILWENRSFYYDAQDGTSKLIPVLEQTAVGQCVDGAMFWDLDPLLGGSLTAATAPQPASIPNPYCHGGRTLATTPGQMFPLPALDEGGNAWIDVRYGPLTRAWPADGAPWDYGQ